MIKFLTELPIDYYLHLFGGMFLLWLFWYLIDRHKAFIIVLIVGFLKEWHDLIFTTGWSWRDIVMNLFGVWLGYWICIGAKSIYSKWK